MAGHGNTDENLTRNRVVVELFRSLPAVCRFLTSLVPEPIWTWHAVWTRQNQWTDPSVRFPNLKSSYVTIVTPSMSAGRFGQPEAVCRHRPA